MQLLAIGYAVEIDERVETTAHSHHVWEYQGEATHITHLGTEGLLLDDGAIAHRLEVHS